MTAGAEPRERLLEVTGLKVHFPVRSGLLSRVVGQIKAVDGVDFFVDRGETVGLVGESGSGKTTLGRSIVRLIQPTAGSVRFRMEDRMVELTTLGRSEMRAVRRRISMLFQDPNSSLNPRLRVGNIVAEPLKVHGIGTARERDERVRELLVKVGLSADHVNMHPHQFSGGQRQRIGIARALSINPELVVCDEPVSALDVSVQAQVLNLLADLQSELGLTFIFIAHDLSVVEYISNRVMVMYLGNIVEAAPTDIIYQRPRHPYTEGLLAAIPRHRVGVMRRFTLAGGVPDPADPPSGCAFHTRCPYVEDRCRTEKPTLRPIDDGRSFAACHRADELDLKGHQT
jgi:oligopeptide/dipeptide ABC transporter ATP-binding protein